MHDPQDMLAAAKHFGYETLEDLKYWGDLKMWEEITKLADLLHSHKNEPRYVNIKDQDGNVVGQTLLDKHHLEYVEGWRDERGTIWTPPTAYDYCRTCRALDNVRSY